MIPQKEFVVEVAFTAAVPYLVEVVHVELGEIDGYLADERGVVAVLEVTRQDVLRKGLFVEDAEAFAVGGPTGDMAVAGVLGYKGYYL